MAQLRNVVLMVREARRGFPASCRPISDERGRPLVYRDREAAEKAAARLRRVGPRLNHTTFHAGWLPEPF